MKEYMSTNFGTASSSRFPYRARTDRQTDATERPTQPAWVNSLFTHELGWSLINAATARSNSLSIP